MACWWWGIMDWAKATSVAVPLMGMALVSMGMAGWSSVVELHAATVMARVPAKTAATRVRRRFIWVLLLGGVVEAGHHAGLCVVGVVAMDHPLPGIVGGEVHIGGSHGRDEKGVLARTGSTGVTELERVAVQV